MRILSGPVERQLLHVNRRKKVSIVKNIRRNKKAELQRTVMYQSCIFSSLFQHFISAEPAAEISGGATDRVIIDSRYTEARYSEARL